MTHEEVIDMLRAAADTAGLTLPRFFELGMVDALTDPELRDLWLIWRDEINATDLV